MAKAKSAAKAKSKVTAKASAKSASAKKAPAKSPVKSKALAKTPVKKTVSKPEAKAAPKAAAKPAAKAAPKKPVKRVALPKGYKLSEKDPYMNPQQQEYFRQKLLAWKDELMVESLETLNHLKEENWNEPDLNDRATVETETSLELRTRDRYRKLIYKIDSALRRLDEGEYGYCEETGDPIGLKRLDARPIATLSIAAQERHERMEKQHSDE